MSELEKRICADCPSFDRIGVKGEPFGTVVVFNLSDQLVLKVDEGVCRRPYGLLLGRRQGNMRCQTTGVDNKK